MNMNETMSANGLATAFVAMLLICNHIHYKVWDEITYPFLNFNGVTVEV